VDTLERERFLVEAPLLPVHPIELPARGAATREDWLATAHGSLADLASRTGQPVAVVGASMGALLAVDLACSHPDLVGALVLIAPPVGPGRATRARRALRRWRGLVFPSRRGTAAETGPATPDVADPAAAMRLRSLSNTPPSALQEYEKLLGETVPLYGEVRQRVLVAHGRLDRTTSRADVEEATRRLAAGAAVESLWLEQSAHLVAVDRQKAAFAARVVAFLRQALSPTSSGAQR
jgi:esterase/lipase